MYKSTKVMLVILAVAAVSGALADKLGSEILKYVCLVNFTAVIGGIVFVGTVFGVYNLYHYSRWFMLHKRRRHNTEAISLVLGLLTLVVLGGMMEVNLTRCAVLVGAVMAIVGVTWITDRLPIRYERLSRQP